MKLIKNSDLRLIKSVLENNHIDLVKLCTDLIRLKKVITICGPT